MITNKRWTLLPIVLLLTLAVGVFVSSPNVAYAKTSPHRSGTLIISNNILKVAIEDESLNEGIGAFTIATDAGHPNPGQDVFYDGAAEYPWSSFTTIRVEDTQKEYVTSTYDKTPSLGYNVECLDDYSPVVTAESETQATISWMTTESLVVTMLIDIRGTSVADTMVQVTVTVQNDDAVPHSVAVRHEWDIMIDGSDDSWIRVWADPSTPGTWTQTETDWPSPSFQFWETVNDPTSPVFSVYGSTSSPVVDPPPTVPDRFVYASWSDCQETAFDFTPSGRVGEDSAVLYYWNATAISAGGQISRTAYVTTVVGAEQAFAWSTDSAGSSTSTFDLSDNVYVNGLGFPADTDVTVFLIPDGMEAIPANAVANASTATNSTGGLPVTMVWSQPLALGEYDIWVDLNQSGIFDEGDVWNSQSIGIYALDVVPEFLASASMLLVLIALTSAIALYKRRSRTQILNAPQK